MRVSGSFPVAVRFLSGSNRGKEYSLEYQRLNRLSPEVSFPVVSVARKLLKILVTRFVSTPPPSTLKGTRIGGCPRWGLWAPLSTLAALTECEAVVACPTGALQTYRWKRADKAVGLALIWELGDG